MPSLEDEILLVEDDPDRQQSPSSSVGRGLWITCSAAAKYADLVTNCLPHLILVGPPLARNRRPEVIREINEELKTIPVVIITSSDAEPDIDAAYRQHASAGPRKVSAVDVRLGVVLAGLESSPRS